MNLPLISIIVPVYKVEPYLRKCVDSILAQTYSNIEVILVDDGSPDGCPSICDEYAKKDSRVVVIHQQNAGLSAARNAGLDVARGGYIGFVDSDDWIEPDMYEVLQRLIQKYDADISIIDVCNDTEQYVQPPLRKEKVEIFHKEEAMIELLMSRTFKGYMGQKLYKASLFENIRFPKERISFEDIVLSSELFGNIEKVVYQKYHCYHYLNRSSSLSRKLDNQYWTIQTAVEMVCANVNRLIPKLNIYADSAVLKNIIPLANLVADNKQLTKANYTRIRTQLSSHASWRSIKLIEANYRLWYYTFVLGRGPFICIRKLWVFLKRYSSRSR